MAAYGKDTISINTGMLKTERGYNFELKTKGARPSFITEAKEDICLFTHIESFGFKIPIISSLVDFLILKVFDSWFRIDLIRKDMEEDSKNLKRILEGD